MTFVEGVFRRRGRSLPESRPNFDTIQPKDTRAILSEFPRIFAASSSQRADLATEAVSDPLHHVLQQIRWRYVPCEPPHLRWIIDLYRESLRGAAGVWWLRWFRSRSASRPRFVFAAAFAWTSTRLLTLSLQGLLQACPQPREWPLRASNRRMHRKLIDQVDCRPASNPRRTCPTSTSTPP